MCCKLRDPSSVHCGRHPFPFTHVLFLERNVEAIDQRFDCGPALRCAQGSDRQIDHVRIGVGLNHVREKGNHPRVRPPSQSQDDIIALSPFEIRVVEHFREMDNPVLALEVRCRDSSCVKPGCVAFGTNSLSFRTTLPLASKIARSAGSARESPISPRASMLSGYSMSSSKTGTASRAFNWPRA